MSRLLPKLLVPAAALLCVLITDYHFNRDYIIGQPEVEMTGAVHSEAGEPISIRFERFSISPVSATFFISLEEDLNDEFILLNSLSLVSGLRLEDGRIITSRYSLIEGEAAQYTSGGTTSGRCGEDGRHYYSLNMQFSEIIDASSVASAIISDVEIPLSDAFSEVDVVSEYEADTAQTSVVFGK